MQISEEHMKILNILVKIGIDNASRSFSKTIKKGALIQLISTKLVDISEITEEMNNDSREMVGAMLKLKGGFQGKLLFMIPLDGAMVLQDLYIGSPQGTSKEFDEYTEGTVQELGNILASSIGNSFAADFGTTLLPTPPQVVCDFAGTIFSLLVLEDAIYQDKILLIETIFKLHKTEIDCYFFLLPDINTLEDSLNKLEKSAIGN
ncbi:MAG: chemotaxis protein CheC [Candidatus Scalinduaceae bacterium]